MRIQGLRIQGLLGHTISEAKEPGVPALALIHRLFPACSTPTPKLCSGYPVWVGFPNNINNLWV